MADQAWVASVLRDLIEYARQDELAELEEILSTALSGFERSEAEKLPANIVLFPSSVYTRIHWEVPPHMVNRDTQIEKPTERKLTAVDLRDDRQSK